MKRNEIEKNLRKEISDSVPDVLDHILVKCEEMKGFDENMENVNKENKIKKPFNLKLAGALAMVMICLCGIFGTNIFNENYKIDSIVELDVNPSIELKINKKEKIVEALPLNEDGKKILGEMNLKNTDINVATNAIVGSMLKNGFISTDANSILVSVKNDNENKAKSLQEKIAKDIEELLKASSIDGAILSQTFNENENTQNISGENNLSEGKTKLINQILETDIKDAKGNSPTFESLSKLSINELNVLMTSKQSKPESVQSTGTASKTAYIGEEKAKNIALSDANVSADKISLLQLELDYDDGIMIYDVSFNVGNTEYDYEINAKTGAILEKDVDIDDDNYQQQSTPKQNTSTTIQNNTQSSQKNSTPATSTTTPKSNNNEKSTSTPTSSSNTSKISSDKAKSIAFSHANVNSQNVKNLRVELDNDDGKQVYEVDFRVGNYEYDYEIDASTGKILKSDKELDD